MFSSIALRESSRHTCVGLSVYFGAQGAQTINPKRRFLDIVILKGDGESKGSEPGRVYIPVGKQYPTWHDLQSTCGNVGILR